MVQKKIVSTVIEAANMERLMVKIFVDTYLKRSHTLIEKVWLLARNADVFANLNIYRQKNWNN